MSQSTEPLLNRRCALQCLACILLGGPGVQRGALAASDVPARPVVEPFSPGLWTRWGSTLPRPAVVVFTRTTCAVCPEVIHALRVRMQERQVTTPLRVVYLDGEALSDSQGHSAPLAGERVFASFGQEAALRHAIDPGWRGVTPYVALFGRDGRLQFSAGMPSEDRLEEWLRERSPSRR